ncbi:MAG: inositol monophosphatase family protein [Candidatus Woesearchaeota archaeon]
MKETLKQALLLGGEILQKEFGNIHSYEVKENQSSIVTVADIQAEQAILKHIQETYPKHNILAEESGFVNNNSEYTWIVDPLDGSSNYQVGIGWFGVMICVLKEKQPVLAGIYLPISNELYLAEKGVEVTKNDKLIRVSNQNKLENVLFAYGLDAGDKEKLHTDIQNLSEILPRIRNLRATNSAVDFCYVADGRLGGFVNQTTKIWDVAAPQLIIEEAGGVVTDVHGKALVYDFSQVEKNYTFVAANPVLHKEIISLLKK